MEDQIKSLNVISNQEQSTKKTRRRKKKDKEKIGVPSVQRAWKVGYSAAQANLPESRNPFNDTASEEFEAWLEGWWSGFYDEPLQAGLAQ